MRIDAYDVPPMIRLLEAFDRGLDLDQAFTEIFELAPEEVDARFQEFVHRKVAGLALEPRWSASTLAELRYSLPQQAPDASGDPAARRAWIDGLGTLAWGSWQNGRTVDAQEALRRLKAAGEEPARASFLRGEIALSEGRRDEAQRLWSAAVEAGGRDFRALVGLGSLAREQGDPAEAERFLLLAEEAFPGYDDPSLAAELRLADFYRKRGESMDEANAFEAVERWLEWNSGEYPRRVEVADWHLEQGRAERAAQLYEEACEIDPFRRALHASWGRALQELGRHETALREFQVAELVPLLLEGGADPRLKAVSAELAGNDELRDLAGRHPFGFDDTTLERLNPNLRALVLQLRAADLEARAVLFTSQAECLDVLGRPEEVEAARARAEEAVASAVKDRDRAGELVGER
jgi:tetratricopeptide (TPR) repeat protein